MVVFVETGTLRKDEQNAVAAFCSLAAVTTALTAGQKSFPAGRALAVMTAGAASRGVRGKMRILSSDEM